MFLSAANIHKNALKNLRKKESLKCNNLIFFMKSLYKNVVQKYYNDKKNIKGEVHSTHHTEKDKSHLTHFRLKYIDY